MSSRRQLLNVTKKLWILALRASWIVITSFLFLLIIPAAPGWNWVQDMNAPDLLWGVDGCDPLHAWAGGNSGLIYAYDSGAWSLQTTVTGRSFRSFYAADPDHVWAGSDSGYIFFFDGANWMEQTRLISWTGTVNGLSGLGSDNVWAVTARQGSPPLRGPPPVEKPCTMTFI